MKKFVKIQSYCFSFILQRHLMQSECFYRFYDVRVESKKKSLEIAANRGEK